MTMTPNPNNTAWVLVDGRNDLDFPLSLWVWHGATITSYRVQYGLQCTEYDSIGKASDAYGACTFHALACMNRL